MKYVLPIKSSYVSRWGIWECLRELIQNAVDEEDENGNMMNITHEAGWLHIANEGADLDVQALLIGQSSKSGKRELRGEHGEGLDLALLAGVRDDYDIRVETKTETWTPKLEYVAQYKNAHCLVVSTRKLRKERSGVRVSVRIDRKTWTQYKRRFLFLDPPKNMVEARDGALIFDDDRKGEIYVKGIYVMKAHETFGHGFNLTDVRLDRDRQMIESFDLQWAMASIIRTALARKPKEYAPRVLSMLSENSDEVEYLGSHLDKGSEGSVALAAAFCAEHGEDAIPVSSMAESEHIAHLGGCGIVTNAATVKAVGPELGTYDVVSAKLQASAKTIHSWQDLTEVEQANLTRAEAAIADILAPHLDNVKAQLQVVDFADKGTEGSCNLGTGEIKIDRGRCTDYFDLMEVMVHEVAHAVSQSGDGQGTHIRTMEIMWRRLYQAACEAQS